MSSVTQTYRFITKTPGIRGGCAHLENMRIGVHDIIGLIQNGETIDSVTRLTHAQVYECLAYYEDHMAEIDLLIARQMSEPGE